MAIDRCGCSRCGSSMAAFMWRLTGAGAPANRWRTATRVRATTDAADRFRADERSCLGPRSGPDRARAVSDLRADGYHQYRPRLALMLGAVLGVHSVNVLGFNYWLVLIVAPLVIGLVGVFLNRTVFQHVVQRPPTVGLLATAGLLLIIDN